jgi:hypothetical protein
MGADERQLRTNLPKPAVGFQPPLPLIINIQIARATGEIMTCKLRLIAVLLFAMLLSLADAHYQPSMAIAL